MLIFDEIAKGTLHMEDEVTTSAYAKSMDGSQVYLEEGEKQTVETMRLSECNFFNNSLYCFRKSSSESTFLKYFIAPNLLITKKCKALIIQ